MFTAAEVAIWGPEDALHELKTRLPMGWKLTLRREDRYVVVELFDESESRTFTSTSFDPKLLYLEALGWLMSRDYKPLHPAWKPREHEVALHVPNPETHVSVPLDLDPDEVSAVYKNRR